MYIVDLIQLLKVGLFKRKSKERQAILTILNRDNNQSRGPQNITIFIK
jgi:hypothetical protein